MPYDPIANHYARLKLAAKRGLKSPAVRAELIALCGLAFKYVRDYSDFQELQSFVPGKEYMMARLKTGTFTSRPINKALFDLEMEGSDIEKIMEGETLGYSDDELSRYLYTIAISYCLTVDLVSIGNKKSPATFFEIFVGHLAATKFGVNPTTSIEIPSLDIENTLPTDLIYDLGPKQAKIHMPVKLSTRERVVQAWAHQRVLEGMHGAGRFRGILVVLTETNKQKDTSVVEVCLPGQWAAYQMYISPMFRIYYFDMPKKYEPLRLTYPFVPVWPFSKFFQEHKEITSPPS